ncbi:MAG: trypsin-like peptidase domain-containing protein [Bacteriovoracaceae bacterium]|nr:trypsin-like peptidase domain-containing protein [Bacteriovoracaceae bacterium]
MFFCANAHSTLFNEQGVALKAKRYKKPDVNWVRVDKKSVPSTRLMYSGVGTLRYAQCNGFFIDQGAGDQAPAYFITAGHCIKKDPNSSRVDTRYDGKLGPEDLVIDKDYLENIHFLNGKKKGSIRIKKIKLATRRKRDFAILESKKSVGEVKQYATPFELYDGIELFEEQTIVIPNFPISVDSNHLYISTCQILKAPKLRKVSIKSEKDNGLFFYETFPHRCSILPGSSGSPALDEQTGRVIGVSSSQVSTHNYTSQLSKLYNCFDESGIWNHQQTDCPLK